MLEARSYRRVRSGQAAARRRGGGPAAARRRPASRRRTVDDELREEVRRLVIARNERRLRQGEEPLDVEAETERQLARFRRIGLMAGRRGESLRGRGAAGPARDLLQPADRGRRDRRRLDLARPGGLQHGGLRGRRLGAGLRRRAGRRGPPRPAPRGLPDALPPGLHRLGLRNRARAGRRRARRGRGRARSPAARTSGRGCLAPMLEPGQARPTSPCPTRTATRSRSRTCAARRSSSISTRGPTPRAARPRPAGSATAATSTRRPAPA